MIEIGAILIAVLLAALLIFVIYRASRTFDAGAHATYLTTKGGSFYGALRAPVTLWDPSIKILRDRHAPDITIMTVDAAGTTYFEKTLVNRRTGEISLRVHTCAPRPFVTRTSDKRSLTIRAKVSFQLDIERIAIPSQMDAFGVALGSRIENMFDNAIGEMEDQDVFARQREIEQRVLRELIDMENAVEGQQTAAMPLGIKIFEAMFSFEATAKQITKEGATGAMAYDSEHLDDLADMLEKANPQTIEVLMRMMELQTRQNIVEMLCKTGGLVAFTATELGLSDRTVERASNGMNIMKPPAYSSANISTNGAAEPAPAAAAAQAAPVDPAQAYYALGAPKGKHSPAGNN